MAKTKTKKSAGAADVAPDMESLKSDVASFASSLGLASSAPSSGFNDVDFRKPPRALKDKPKPKQNQKQKSTRPEQKVNAEDENKKKSAFAELSEKLNSDFRGIDKFKTLPKLPLVKVTELGLWYDDVAELEKKVVGGVGRKPEVRDVAEWKKVVEKKREVGERLMAQYAWEYERTEGRRGDVNMLFTTQKLGTAADKVSAYTVLVGENPVANLRSLDALIGRK